MAGAGVLVRPEGVLTLGLIPLFLLNDSFLASKQPRLDGGDGTGTALGLVLRTIVRRLN